MESCWSLEWGGGFCSDFALVRILEDIVSKLLRYLSKDLCTKLKLRDVLRGSG